MSEYTTREAIARGAAAAAAAAAAGCDPTREAGGAAGGVGAAQLWGLAVDQMWRSVRSKIEFEDRNMQLLAGGGVEHRLEIDYEGVVLELLTFLCFFEFPEFVNLRRGLNQQINIQNVHSLYCRRDRWFQISGQQ